MKRWPRKSSRNTARKLHDALDTKKYPKKESYHLIDEVKKAINESIPEEDEEKPHAGHARLRAPARADISARISCSATAAPMLARSTKSATLPAKWECCRARTARRCLRAAKRRPWRRPRSAPRKTSSASICSSRKKSFKRFMLHYNFPPFSVGEVKFLRGPGRREIGHGALAERALVNLLPPETDFPYAMRLVSDIMESNGSSSMATVCGGSLSLMDAGVPITLGVRGHRHGPGHRRRETRHPHRHRRRGRSLRRHGFQGCRHAHRNHRPPDGHQSRRRQRGADAPGARAGPARALAHPGHHGPDHFIGARQDVDIRSAPAISCRFPRTRFAT